MAIKCNLLTGFLTTYLKILSKFVKFCSKHLTSNRCISGLPCPIAMRFFYSKSTFQALQLVIKIDAHRTTLKVEKQS